MKATVAKSASAGPKTFRRSRVWVASLIAIGLGALVATLMTGWSLGKQLELAASDFLRPFRALPDEPPGAESVPITLVLIDDGALEEFGRWPWPWTRMADIVDTLAELEARLVVLDIEFPEADRPLVVEKPGPDGKPEERIVRTVPRFVASVRAAGNVLIPFSVYFKDRPGAVGAAPHASSWGESPPDVGVPDSLRRHIVPHEGEPPYPYPPSAEGFKPMIPDLAAACAGSGFTSYPAPDPGGVVRRVPMLAWGRWLFPHLMLEAAGYWRFGRDYEVAPSGRWLSLQSADRRQTVSVPLDRNYQLELRWPASQDSTCAIPAARLLEYADARRVSRAIAAELDALFSQDEWAPAAKALEDLQARAAAGGPDAPPADALRQGERRLDAIVRRYTVALDKYVSGQDAGLPGIRQKLPPAKAGIYRKVLLNGDLDGEELRQVIQGRLCIVGISATGVAKLDLHTTPVGQNRPGVTVYPAGIRTILSGVAFRHLEGGPAWLLAVLAAWAMGVLGARLRTGWGIAAAVWLSVAALAAARIAVALDPPMLLPVAGPVLAIVVAFAGVSGYRQLTEASSRRWITRVFQQYTSAEHVAEILRRPEILRLGGERREITVLFSDLAGFTPLSERLAPEALVAVLNRYLSAMTEVLLAEKATVDKYEGDGILAFFGAPVAASDHALRAVRAALAMQAALPRVNAELAQAGLLPEGTRLAMRIGCSTGPAIVGNFGSEQRFDYTAMGDTVNLGGRLEEANRWLGSRILVPEATRAACAGAVLFRRLGPARIRGKAEPVPLYEPLAPSPAPPGVAAVAESFGRAIDALSAGDLPAAEKAVADLLAQSPEDGPAKALKARLEAIRADRVTPDEPWDLARPK